MSTEPAGMKSWQRVSLLLAVNLRSPKGPDMEQKMADERGDATVQWVPKGTQEPEMS